MRWGSKRRSARRPGASAGAPRLVECDAAPRRVAIGGACFLALHVRINGRKRGVSVPPAQRASCATCKQADPAPRYHLPLGPVKSPVFSEVTSPGAWSAVICIDSDPQPCDGIHVVIDGIEYVHKNLFMICPEISVTVAAPELQCNISHTGFVEDERWTEVRTGLTNAVLRMSPICRRNGGRSIPRTSGPRRTF